MGRRRPLDSVCADVALARRVRIVTPWHPQSFTPTSHRLLASPSCNPGTRKRSACRSRPPTWSTACWRRAAASAARESLTKSPEAILLEAHQCDQARRSRILCATETALHVVPRSLRDGQPNCPSARTARNNMQRGSSCEKDPACRAFSHMPNLCKKSRRDFLQRIPSRPRAARAGPNRPAAPAPRCRSCRRGLPAPSRSSS